MQEDLQHMRKVVSYNKRHLAQGETTNCPKIEVCCSPLFFLSLESKMKETKSKEEMEQTKSVRSLRNWGHDPLKY